MKTISQIAKECGLHYDTVFRTVRGEQITTVAGGTKINLTNTQADHIQQTLHNRGYFTHLTLESKINSKSFDQDQFNLHKKNIYGTK